MNQKSKINIYEHNSLLSYLYTSKYPKLIKLIVAFIGGRKGNIKKDNISEISRKDTIHAINLLDTVLKDLPYTDEEYAKIVYEFSEPETIKFSPIKNESLYEMSGEHNFFNLYEKVVRLTIESLLDPKRLLRLAQNPHISMNETLWIFTQNIFSDQKSIFHRTLQYLWIYELMKRYREYIDQYYIRDAALFIANKIKSLKIEKTHRRVLERLIDENLSAKFMLPNQEIK